eukprot:76876-Lingulodinium_polyedra.AAC.1
MTAARLRQDKRDWTLGRADEVTNAYEAGATGLLWQMARALAGGRRARPRRVAPVLRDQDGAV